MKTLTLESASQANRVHPASPESGPKPCMIFTFTGNYTACLWHNGELLAWCGNRMIPQRNQFVRDQIIARINARFPVNPLTMARNAVRFNGMIIRKAASKPQPDMTALRAEAVSDDQTLDVLLSALNPVA